MSFPSEAVIKLISPCSKIKHFSGHWLIQTHDWLEFTGLKQVTLEMHANSWSFFVFILCPFDEFFELLGTGSDS